MELDLLSASDQIAEASSAEDLYGAVDVFLPPSTMLQKLAEKHDPLQALVNPEGLTDVLERESAEEASAKLAELHADAMARLRLGLYGLPGRERLKPRDVVKSFRVGANTYYVGPEIVRTGRCIFYRSYVERAGEFLGQAVIKLVENTSENPFAEQEIANLAALHAEEVPQWRHLPLVLDRFQTGGRIGFVMRRICGVSLTHLRQHPPHAKGVDQRDMIWMLDRTLSCLGYVQRRGILHGCLNPDHIMLHGPQHNALFVGWGNAVQNPAITGAQVEAAPTVFTAPEVRDRGKIGPWSDIYSLGKVFIWLLGGDPVTDEIPAEVEVPIRDFLLRMVAEDRYARSADAWELHTEECLIKDRLWPKKFRHLAMPELDW